MRWLLDGPHAPVRERVRAVLCRPEFAYPEEACSLPARREWTLSRVRDLADEGFGALGLPAEFGGTAASDARGSFGEFMAAFETISTHDISVAIKFTVQFGLFMGSVRELGTAKHHERYLPDIAAGRAMGCFGMTEIGHGSNVRELETTARYDAATGEFVLHSPGFSAGKNYLGNAAAHGRLCTVFAQLEMSGEGDDHRHGVHAFLAPIRDDAGNILPGVKIADNGPKMGENGVDNGRVWFADFRVPREALLDRFAQVNAEGEYVSDFASASARFFATIGTLVGGRISIAAAGLSVAKSALTIALRYAARRRQFRATPDAAEEQPLLDYPTHQRRLLPLLANAYATHFALQETVRRRETARPEEARELEALAAALKFSATWNCTRTVQTCRECCGGEGYISANRLPALKADSDIFTTFEGDNTVLSLWVGRNLLATAAKADAAREPLKPARWSANRLRDAHAHGHALRFREQETLRDAGRLVAAQKAGEPEAAFGAALALSRAANAHAERVFAEAFARAVATCSDEGLRPTLETLRALFALTRLEEDRAWFLENEYFDAAQSRAVGLEVQRLCAELAPAAVALADSFGIPDAVLAAPIATGVG